MKTLILSDTHLTHQFDARWCDYTVALVRQADRVVVNGDFWDHYLTSFAAFWEAWQPLLQVLASRETIYLEGNHDRFIWTDDRVQQFAAWQGTEYRLKVGKTLFWIRHGDDLSNEFDKRHPHLTQVFQGLYPFLVRVRERKHLGKWVRWYSQRVCEQNHEQLLAFAQDHCSAHELLVCGHTHIQAELPEQHYLNPGAYERRCARFVWVDGARYECVSEFL